ncbi:MAG TPA: ABC transporter permease [Pyrinomonadaceae bacterium]|nr:ABC transporter permease [Pyrinomonadaceae bacterium]
MENSAATNLRAPAPKAAKSGRADRRRLAYQLTGVALALLLWQFFTSPLFLTEQFSRSFSPGNTFGELFRFISGGAFTRHAVPSLSRVGVGLAVAIAAGIPVGILIGYFSKLNLLTNTVFQFIRMTSPLAWMPIAIIIFGVGNNPVYFLIAMAAVWPIIINTAHGVRNVNPIWVKVVRMLGGAHRQVLRRAVIPAIIPDMLTGLRISLGISWIILVPAEMLGVSSGLGYYILDTRDRFNYGELTAVILVVGFFGFISDTLLRLLQQRFSWRKDTEQGLVL